MTTLANAVRPNTPMIYAATLIALRAAKVGTKRRKELVQRARDLRAQLTPYELDCAHRISGGVPELEEP